METQLTQQTHSGNSTRTLEYTYGFIALIGLIATWTCNILFIQQHGGFSVLQYLSENFVNYGSASISNDIIVVVLAFFVWSFNESKKLGMKHWWAYIPLTFCIAIAVALPVFLMMRERKLRALNAQQQAT